MTNITSIRLYCPYYHDVDPIRRSEIDQCLQNNINNSAFEKIILFVDSLEQYSYLESERVALALTPERMPTHNDFLEHANATGEKFILVMANGDICFDESIEITKKLANLSNHVWCLSRREGSKESHPLYTEHYQSSDVWIMLAPTLQIREKIQVGKLHCESFFLNSLSKTGYSLQNVSLDINCFHLHASQKRNYDPSKDRYTDQSRMSYPLLGTCPSLKRPLSTKRDKILIDSSVFSWGHQGAIIAWRQLIEQLANSNLKDKLVLLEQSDLAKQIPISNRIQGPPLNPHLPLSQSEVIESICSKVNAALFVSGGYQTAKNTLTLNFIYDIKEIQLDAQLELIQNKYLALWHSHAYVFFSDSVRQACQERFTRIKYAPSCVISPAGNPRISRADPALVSHFLSEIGITRPYLIYIGERSGPANHGNADEIVRALKDIEIPLDILFVGGRDNLEQAIVETGIPQDRIKLCRPDDSALSILLSGAYAHVISSRAHGLGLSALDAMACNCPVISRDSALELGDNSCLNIPNFTTPHLLDCYHSLTSNDLQKSQTKAGREHATKRSWTKSSQTFIELVKSVYDRLIL